MSIKVKINNDWVDTNIQAVRGVNHVNSEDVYTKQESNALFSGKISKTDIVQSTGTSTTSVMSQKAVTENINNLKEDIFGFDKEIYGAGSDIARTEYFSLEPNTKYIVSLDNNTWEHPQLTSGYDLFSLTYLVDGVSTYLIRVQMEGIPPKEFTIVTPANADNNLYRFGFRGNVGVTLKINISRYDDLKENVENVENIEKILDIGNVEKQVIQSLKYDNALHGYYKDSLYNFNTSTIFFSFLIDVKGGTNITISNKVGKTNCRVFNKEGEEILNQGEAYYNDIENGTFLLPQNAVKFSLVFNVNYWGGAIIVSNSTIVKDSTTINSIRKPRLTDVQKNNILQLISDYYTLRDNFTYDTTVIRASYANSNIVTGGKVRICCNTFVQHILMGRKPTFAINPSQYTNVIEKAFDGFYFRFPMAKYCAYKTRKPLTVGDTDTNAYFGYTKKAVGSFSYTTKQGSSNYAGSQQYLNFSNAADLAYELWNMGLEISRQEAEVGDIIFYKDQVMQNTSLFAETNFREITHVAIIIDVNYKGEGFLRVAHSAFDDGAYIKGDARGTWTEADGVSDQTIFISSVNDEIPYWSCKMGDYERRIAMIARNPMAVISGNVPDSIVN